MSISLHTGGKQPLLLGLLSLMSREEEAVSLRVLHRWKLEVGIRMSGIPFVLIIDHFFLSFNKLYINADLILRIIIRRSLD